MVGVVRHAAADDVPTGYVVVDDWSAWLVATDAAAQYRSTWYAVADAAADAAANVRATWHATADDCSTWHAI